VRGCDKETWERVYINGHLDGWAKKGDYVRYGEDYHLGGEEGAVEKAVREKPALAGRSGVPNIKMIGEGCGNQTEEMANENHRLGGRAGPRLHEEKRSRWQKGGGAEKT